MKLLAIIALCVALVASAPTSNSSNESSSEEDNKLNITEEFFPDEFKIHTADNEIIKLLYPLNSLNFNEDADEIDTEDEDSKIIFFVEADITNGVEYKGLSVFKKNKTTKILPTGTSAAADSDDSKTAYFGATDGLYKYNEKENTAEKYGPITDSIIDIAKVNSSDIIYILTDKNELFKVTEDGTKKDKIADVVGAKQIILDYSSNLYYYDGDKKVYVVSADGVKKIEGLPSDPTYINLLNPAFVIEDAIPIVLDNNAYIIYANGSSKLSDVEFTVKPSAYSMEATLIQYYAYNKSIYEYNILSIVLGDALEEIRTFLNENKSEIETIATRSRTDF
ncbi:Uncharacterized protein OBRU01_03138 [Operophtera brumata]|uniref:Ommochrome-binding protein n=1 Tax=Operophtera brumata TaxID=104452 RepID=A0A0L7LQD5_OPEBR|nr:Uncharacterized protein OBRU01_03138 [Operophtera brumata]